MTATRAGRPEREPALALPADAKPFEAVVGLPAVRG